jgi:murein DD-endopeptidase MepM/ murein hydrolase activator NlpD
MNSINGSLAATEEFAIDWVRVDAQGRMFTGDFKDPKHWYGYGAELLAVAPGLVVEVVSDLPDEVAGKSPDNLTIEQFPGNRVIIDLGLRRYAEYDHMVPHSVTIHVGDYVRQGQKVGLLGNSGNTDAPHLHFQLMNRPSTLDGSALPFVFDSMRLQGRVTMTLDELDALMKKSSPVPIDAKDAEALTRTMPLSLDVIGFK